MLNFTISKNALPSPAAPCLPYWPFPGECSAKRWVRMRLCLSVILALSFVGSFHRKRSPSLSEGGSGTDAGINGPSGTPVPTDQIQRLSKAALTKGELLPHFFENILIFQKNRGIIILRNKTKYIFKA